MFEYHSRGSLYAVLTKTTVTHKEFVILAESTASGEYTRRQLELRSDRGVLSGRREFVQIG